MPDDSGSSKKTLIQKLFGKKTDTQMVQETEEEILSLVEEGQEKGLIGDDTKNIIENIFDFDDTVAYEIMTHRRDMVAIEDTDSLEEAVNIAVESGYSRIPVYHDDIDSIIGVLYVKDLLKYVCLDVPKNFKISDIVRKVLFVPRTKDCRSLFAQMNKEKTQIAIVVDEYGGTEGLLTLEDLIEDILGNIQDEYDNEKEEIEQISDRKFTVDGSTSIEDIEELIGEDIYDDDSDTIAGFMLTQLGRVPDEDEHPTVSHKGFNFTVLETEDRRMKKILIEKLD
ncbi:MAG: HlyC/CorC family transporter [Ruminococcus sp.]|nr:HlyC/CorC family transporter [Ruminococcus sp.]MBQ2972511.1 HlyC/CorC family transporter [Ruminococcus sp.]